MNKFSLFCVSTALAATPALADYAMQYQHLEDIRCAKLHEINPDELQRIGEVCQSLAFDPCGFTDPHRHDSQLRLNTTSLSRICAIQRETFDTIEGRLPENGNNGNAGWTDLRQALLNVQNIANAPQQQKDAIQTFSDALSASITPENEKFLPEKATKLVRGIVQINSVSQGIAGITIPAQGTPEEIAVRNFTTFFATHTLSQSLQHFMGAVRTHDDSIQFGDLKGALSTLQQNGQVQQRQQRNAFNSLVTALAPVNAIQGVLPQPLQDLWAALNTANRAGQNAPNWQGNQQQAFDNFANLIRNIEAIQNRQIQMLDDNNLALMAQYSLFLSWYSEVVYAQGNQPHTLVCGLQNLFASVPLDYRQSKVILFGAAQMLDNLTPLMRQTLQTPVSTQWRNSNPHRTWNNLLQSRYNYTETHEKRYGQHKALEELSPLVVQTLLGASSTAPVFDQNGNAPERHGLLELLARLDLPNDSPSAVSNNFLYALLLKARG